MDCGKAAHVLYGTCMPIIVNSIPPLSFIQIPFPLFVTAFYYYDAAAYYYLAAQWGVPCRIG